MMVIWFGVIQQLRGQEFGEGGHQKVHACPPQGGHLNLYQAVSMWTRGEGCKMSTLVHSRGEGVKIWSKIVHVVVEWPLSKQCGDSNSNHFKSLSFQVKVAGSQITILLSYVALDLEFSNQTTKQSIEALLEGLSNSPSLSQNLKNYLNRLFPTKKQQLVNKQRRLVGLIYVNFWIRG